ncbi:hypothetical protein GOARA_088_00100 [Gordonia araii NBRC 100433]|uniref:Clp R domain-containing protein n=1 Tax=Gordonia araii NBRC 100433 TaxID=1073574 RepID=G7H7C2_9ACTN|nr:Clp protease N-terminal domain-containing protein [Gordonia araii]NNG98430.1 ATP-dependent Clp protease ATP-binding subunit [Gordonia araii NBRC 100433]GAB11747.1 hypothetical protein GOARA_088_00100 [Gordonia araii NBRC 100433]
MFERFSREGRMVLPFAIEEADDLGHSRVGAPHLILGVLCNARDPLVGVLADHGITLDTARTAVREASGDAEPEPTSAEDRYAADRDALKVLGIDLDRVRDAVRKNFGDDLTAGWGQRGERRGRGRRHHGHGRGGGPCGPAGPGGPGEFGPGFGGPGFGPWGEEGPWDFNRGRRGPRGHGRRPRFGGSAKAVLTDALRIAVDHGDRVISTPHLLLAAVDSKDPAVQAIIALAPDADALRDAIAAQLPSPSGV